MAGLRKTRGPAAAGHKRAGNVEAPPWRAPYRICDEVSEARPHDHKRELRSDATAQICKWETAPSIEMSLKPRFERMRKSDTSLST
jgi:hypothetical protein